MIINKVYNDGPEYLQAFSLSEIKLDTEHSSDNDWWNVFDVISEFRFSYIKWKILLSVWSKIVDNGR